MISSDSVIEAIITLAAVERYGLIIVGASNEGLLQNVVRGNIPYAIAREVDTTVIIFRSSLWKIYLTEVGETQSRCAE